MRHLFKPFKKIALVLYSSVEFTHVWVSCRWNEMPHKNRDAHPLVRVAVSSRSGVDRHALCCVRYASSPELHGTPWFHSHVFAENYFSSPSPGHPNRVLTQDTDLQTGLVVVEWPTLPPAHSPSHAVQRPRPCKATHILCLQGIAYPPFLLCVASPSPPPPLTHTLFLSCLQIWMVYILNYFVIPLGWGWGALFGLDWIHLHAALFCIQGSRASMDWTCRLDARAQKLELCHFTPLLPRKTQSECDAAGISPDDPRFVVMPMTQHKIISWFSPQFSLIPDNARHKH